MLLLLSGASGVGKSTARQLVRNGSATVLKPWNSLTSPPYRRCPR